MHSRIVKLTLFLFSGSVHARVQSVFRGPPSLKVWEHLQPSWNVEENDSTPMLFELERGTMLRPYLKLRFRSGEVGLKAVFQSESYVPDGLWAVKIVKGPIVEAPLVAREGDITTFFLDDAADFVDSPRHHIVRSIAFRVTDFLGRTVFEENLLPMYFRSAGQNYWNNPVPAYNAHAGSGRISVAKLMEAESGFDRWNEVLVRPVLDFVDRDVLGAGTFVGHHRHENNQEMYFLESGQAVVTMGISQRIPGSDRIVRRRWSEDGETRDVPEFHTQGGWIESREMNPGDLTVIVPTPGAPAQISFHSLRAIFESVVWNLGAKN